MRTIFEDTSLTAEMEESRTRGNERKSTLPILWLVALLFLVGTWGIYRWADSHRAVEPPAPPASLEDDLQTSKAINKFNFSILDGKWAEAEEMLSTAAKEKLKSENKNLAESLLGKFKDYKIVGGEMTQSIDRSIPNELRIDCLYKFSNDPSLYKIEQRIISVVLVIEKDNLNIDRIKIDKWTGADSVEQKEESKTAVSN